LREAPAFCRRLRGWSDAGVEMFAHGWFHRDHASHRGLRKFKASAMTAGEGEFLGLSRSDATQRMADGKALIEDIIGRELAGFVAPAWLYGAESLEALRTSGFCLAEDHMRVWHAPTVKTLARGPVITWASRSRPRQFSSRVFAALARQSLHALPTVRIAVHPGDTSVPALLASIRRTVGGFAARREAGRYCDLLPDRAPA
jgi:predicted deacetylase